MADPQEADSSACRVVVKEMGTTLKEFDRTLPNAAGTFPVTRRGQGYLLNSQKTPSQYVEIDLTSLPERCIASLCLPVTRVELRFYGFASDEQTRFLERFDLYFHKGGG